MLLKKITTSFQFNLVIPDNKLTANQKNLIPRTFTGLGHLLNPTKIRLKKMSNESFCG